MKRKQIITIIKLVLFITILVLTFGIADKLAGVIMNLSFAMLRQIINVVLVIAVTKMFSSKESKK